MKRIIVGTSLGLLMFMCGLVASWLFPVFTMTGNIACDNSYCLYWFQPTMSFDPQAITLYNEFSSDEKSRHLMESNLSNGEILLRDDKLNEAGQKVGERAIVRSSPPNGAGEVRICWTDGSEFWFIAAPSLRLAIRFENSDSFLMALKYNQLSKPQSK